MIVKEKYSYFIKLILCIIISFFLGFSVANYGSSDFLANNNFEKIKLPARSIIDKLIINDIEFYNEKDKKIIVNLSYYAVDGVNDLLEKNMLDGEFEAEINGEIFVNDDLISYQLEPKVERCILNLQDPKELTVEFTFDDQEFKGKFPDDIKSINVLLILESNSEEMFYLNASMIK